MFNVAVPSQLFFFLIVAVFVIYYIYGKIKVGCCCCCYGLLIFIITFRAILLTSLAHSLFCSFDNHGFVLRTGILQNFTVSTP